MSVIINGQMFNGSILSYFFSTFGFFFILSVFLLAIFFIAIVKGTYLVLQSEVIIVERFGKFHSICYPGAHFLIPFIDSPHKMAWTFSYEDPNTGQVYTYQKNFFRIDMRESVYDFPSQSVITKDNVTIEINALLYYQITDPKRAAYEINNLPLAIEKLTQTTLRNVIGSMDLDSSFVSRDQINERLRITLEDASDKWGVKINRVELQEICPPHEIKISMEKQMRAERDRRALILEAEGRKSAAILVSEGERQSMIERAEGEAYANYTLAVGQRKAMIEKALGEAQMVHEIEKAVGKEGLISYLIATKYINVLPEVLKGADGKTVVIPYEATALMGSLSTIKELFQASNQQNKL